MALDVQPVTGRQAVSRSRALVVVTDVSESACTLQGYAVIGTVRAGRRLVLPVVRVGQPGPAAAVEVPEGGSAFAGLEWTPGPGCPDVSALRIGLPGGATPVPVGMVVPGAPATSLAVCTAGIDLGPFVATAQGAVAFPDAPGAGT